MILKINLIPERKERRLPVTSRENTALYRGRQKKKDRLWKWEREGKNETPSAANREKEKQSKWKETKMY